jgi:hypothetical protein
MVRSKILSSEQAQELARIAEQGRKGLSNFVGQTVAYDATAMQYLDEWIDRHLKQFPEPSQKMRLLWTSFLGEMFRRHHEGRWVMRDGKLAIACPTSGDGAYFVEVAEQIDRRIDEGMAESLSYFYNMKRIALMME